MNSAPPSGASPSSIRPACSSTNSFAIARPSPVPPARRVASSSPRAKRANTASRSITPTPGPLSATSIAKPASEGAPGGAS